MYVGKRIGYAWDIKKYIIIPKCPNWIDYNFVYVNFDLSTDFRAYVITR